MYSFFSLYDSQVFVISIKLYFIAVMYVVRSKINDNNDNQQSGQYVLKVRAPNKVNHFII